MFSIAFTHLNACLHKCQLRSVSRVWRTAPRVHLDVDGKWRFLVWGMVLNGEGVRKTNIESLDAELFFKRPPWKSSPWDPKIKSEIHLQFGSFPLQDIAGFLKVGPDISKRDKSVAWRPLATASATRVPLVPHQPDPTSGRQGLWKGGQL
jgi:hypothetical protein